MPTASEIELLRAARTSGIQSREELANFMAQVTHESSDLTDLEEGFRYTRGIDQIPVRSAFRQGREILETARVQALNGQPERLADLMYGGRMGNDDPGDGYLYRGRGYIQITGSNNYREAGISTGLDLEGNPDLAVEPTNAAQIAVWFWQMNVPEAVRENVRDATLAINGGHNGLVDRTERYGRWHTVLTPEFLADLDAGRITPDNVALRQGGKGPEVRSLQESLVKLGITNAKEEALVPDGNYGQSTKEAVAKFQNQHWFHIGGAAGGAYVTGIANQETLKAIQDRVNALDSLHGVRHAGDQFLPLGYRTDWLQTDAQGLPSYLRMNNAQNRTHTHEQVRTPALAPEHDYRAPPPAPRPLSTTETLEPGDRGAAVQALQQHLQLLGATDRYGQKIQDDRDYGERTREAVEQFQLWTGREPTGIADPDTLQAVQAQAQFALRQQAQGLAIASDAHLADHLRPTVSERVDAAIERPVQGRNQAGPPSYHNADPHPGAHSTATSAPSRSGPERKSEPDSAQPQPHSPHDAQAFPTGHRDYALFEAIRRQLPDEYSDGFAAHATLEARKGGINRPDQIRGMAIENGQLTIMGKSGVDFAFIKLAASTPPLQETLQQSAAFDQQQAIQLAQFQEQQRQINQNQGGPTMRL